MNKEKERELNYESHSAEEVVAVAKSETIMQKFCKSCGKVTRHKGLKCQRCS
jgi:hypothetical protein